MAGVSYMNEQIRQNLIADIDRLSREVRYIYDEVMLPTWHDKSGLHGLSNTLYGYVMGVFARIDLFSQFWKGTTADDKQADRMRDFLIKYFGYNKESSYVSVQIWRHALIHTSKPRFWVNKRNDVVYKYLIQWGEQHLSRNQHFTIEGSGSNRKLNIGLLFLIDDLKKGLSHYLDDVDDSKDLENKFNSVYKQLNKE
jgi:hypothetical protein